MIAHMHKYKYPELERQVFLVAKGVCVEEKIA